VARLAGSGNAQALREELSEGLPFVLGQVASQLLPGFAQPLAHRIFAGLRASATLLQRRTKA
jgi:hypothetical protein